MDDISEEKYREHFQYVHEAKDPTPVDCPLRYRCLSYTFREMRSRLGNVRAVLIYIGRFIYKTKYPEMEKIIRLDSSNICRIANKAEKDLQEK